MVRDREMNRERVRIRRKAGGSSRPFRNFFPDTGLDGERGGKVAQMTAFAKNGIIFAESFTNSTISNYCVCAFVHTSS
jgi:hypothetical protein